MICFIQSCMNTESGPSRDPDRLALRPKSLYDITDHLECARLESSKIISSRTCGFKDKPCKEATTKETFQIDFLQAAN